MARSHRENPDFDNHCAITEKAISSYRVYLKDSVKDVLKGSKRVIANTLHYNKDETAMCGYLSGEFFFDSHPVVHLSVNKRMSLVKRGNKFASKTTDYSYNISFKHKSSGAKTCIIRWDNIADHNEDYYGYRTPHHLHIQIDSDYQKNRKKPHPVHGDGNFPYVSDVFELVRIMLGGNVNTYHDKLLTTFTKIPKGRRKCPSDWALLLDKVIKHKLFAKIYL